MALTEVYVDPSLNDNVGNGLIGSPYGDLQYAIDNTTLGTNGTRFNVKSGTAEVLTKPLDFTSGFTGTPSETQIVVIQGYTSAADDGGIGEVEGTTNSVGIVADATAVAPLTFIDMKATAGVTSGFNDTAIGFFIDCELHGNDEVSLYSSYIMLGSAVIQSSSSTSSVIVNANQLQNSILFGNHVKCGTGSFARMFTIRRCMYLFNVCDMKALTDPNTEMWDTGSSRDNCYWVNNTIVEDGTSNSTSGGAWRSAAYFSFLFANNITQGWRLSGPFRGDPRTPMAFINNFDYDDEGWSNLPAEEALTVLEGNELAVASLVVDYANGDWTSDGEAVNAGCPQSFLGLSGFTNGIDVGAVQHESTVASGPTYRMNMRLSISNSIGV